MITKDSKNILVADDSLFFRTRLSDILMEAGHKVYFAKNGVDVINRIKANPSSIDLLVLDLQMPEVDGFEVLTWLGDNGLKGAFPVIAITGVYEEGQVNERIMALGADVLMSKGSSPENVIYRVNKLLFTDKPGSGEKRKRAAVAIPVDFTVEGVTRTGTIINLSESGAFMHTDTRLAEGTVLDIRFSLPGAKKVLQMKGTVRWFPTEVGGQYLFCGCGIMFGAVPEETRRALAIFIEAEFDRLSNITNTNRR